MCFTAAVHEAIVRHVVSDPRQILDSSLPDSNVQQDALRHKAESLQLVSKTLAQAPHAMAEGTILCVSVLRVGEAVFGDKAAIAAHTKGMSRMVEIFGGINLLSSSVVTQVYLSDIKAATVLRTRPSFLLSPLLDRQFGELSMTPLQPSSLSLSGIGARFFSNSIAIYICPELLKWCQYIRHLVNMTVCTQNPQAPSARLSIIDFIILEHHLLSLPHDQFLVGIEEAIRVALLLYSNIGLWHIPRYFAWVEILVSALQAALVSLDWACYSQQCPDLLFWLLMLGLHAAGRRTEVERKWFKESLEDIIKTIGLLKWQGARQILIEFLYVDSVFQKPYEKIWIDMALGSREDREMESMLGRHPCRYKYCQERS
ncbi:hypothetical protein MMC19_000166 [Ptychographa xylographoides]|nr:hypothetical protein [Ptychographa xylographoides]